MTRPQRQAFCFPRNVRLSRQSDFDQVHRANVFAADEVLVLRAVANGLATTRLGISISRHVGNAVIRNRWKRLTREAFRFIRADIPQGLDLVARPRKGAIPELRAIQNSLRKLISRLARRTLKEPS